ncbi:SDR family oxidoreductase [Mycobacterium sp. E2497]|uniref:SDR family oxidoreductase n=1 Tax=Mycobacterium sp. E2497 TaxID=1834135 RepID=UPI0018D444C4|nr:SDR family oxidoreductase [Mycobacterium sp. E2497]
MPEVLVIIGAGGMGTATARRLGFGHLVLLSDVNDDGLTQTAAALTSDGHLVRTAPVDVQSRSSVAQLAEFAASLGRVTRVVHTAGLSPEQAPVEAILGVDLLGVALVLEEFAKVIERHGAGVVISSMAGHLNSPIDPQDEFRLATCPAEELLSLPSSAPQRFSSAQEAYGYAKRANQLRVAAASTAWGARGARINSISPGVISTSMGRQELAGESGNVMRLMVDGSATRRLGTPDDIAAAADFLLGRAASFVTGTDLLVDGGVTAAVRSGAIDFAQLLQNANLSI